MPHNILKENSDTAREITDVEKLAGEHWVLRIFLWMRGVMRPDSEDAPKSREMSRIFVCRSVTFIAYLLYNFNLHPSSVTLSARRVSSMAVPDTFSGTRTSASEVEAASPKRRLPDIIISF